MRHNDMPAYLLMHKLRYDLLQTPLLIEYMAHLPMIMSRMRWSSNIVRRSKTSAPDSPFGNLEFQA